MGIARCTDPVLLLLQGGNNRMQMFCAEFDRANIDCKPAAVRGVFRERNVMTEAIDEDAQDAGAPPR